MSVNVYMIEKAGEIKFLDESFTLASGKKITVREHAKNFIENQIRRANSSFTAISISNSPPSPIGNVDFTLYLLDDPSHSKVRESAEDVKITGSEERSTKSAEKITRYIDDADFKKDMSFLGIAYFLYRLEDGKRTYEHRLSEVYLDRFSDVMGAIKERKGKIPKEIDGLRKEIDDLRAEIAELREEIDKLRAEINDKIGNIKAKRKEINEKTKEIKKKTKEIEKKSKEIDKKSKEIDKRFENLAEGVGRMGAHELAHQISEFGAEIDRKKGLDPHPQLTELTYGPLKFPNGKQLPKRLITKMKKKIEGFLKLP